MPKTELRPEVPKYVIENALDRVKAKLSYRLNEKGRGSFVSSHEILGVITEEYYELIDAVKAKTYGYKKEEADQKKIEMVAEELIDIAVGCLFGIASLGNCEWL